MALDDTAPYQWPSDCGLSLPRQDQESSGYSVPQHLHFSPETAAMFDYAPNDLPYGANYDLTYSSLQPGPSCPRSHSSAVTGLLDMPLSGGNQTESYPPSAYLLEPQKPQEIMDFAESLTSIPTLGMPREYRSPCRQPLVKPESTDRYDLLGYDPQTNALISSTPREDPSLLTGESNRSEACLEESAESKEQPYAQLIYRALMEAPGHTMILRDIYNWFKQNTDKAADKETKGWQNSIRHNLSMNGAFEKVDQPCEESKKGFMWRLTEEAIREGVKSTTRYRSKLPNKRNYRSANPAPQRQASGAKGGQAAKKAAARLRRSERLKDDRGVRTEQHMARSVPDYGFFDSQPSTDLSLSYPASPYFGSEVDFPQGIKQEDLGSAWGSSSEFVSERPTSDASHHLFCPDQAYMLPCSPTEPLFYSDSSPPDSADEPRTPPEPMGDYYVDPMVTIPEEYSMEDNIAPNYMH
jgi:hypothetical protein